MPILKEDEKRYSDCVDLLIYSAAGLRTNTTITNEERSLTVADPIPEGSAASPDQTASHIPPQPVENNPLHGVGFPCYGV